MKYKNKLPILFFATSIFIFSNKKLSAQSKPTIDNHFELSKNLEIFSNIFKELNTYYVEPIKPGELTQNAVNAMLSDLDPYTNYITESDIEDLQFMTTGKYGGIGASVRNKDGYNYIGEIYEGSPAHRFNLNTGDKILSIDGKPMKDKSVEDISLLLKGSPGTQVTLKVEDAITNKETDKTLTRGEIEVTSVPFAGFLGSKNDIAYVKLNQFTQGCAQLIKNALDSLVKINNNSKGVVLDLRSNPGGLLDEAVNVCNLFLDKGQLVVSTKGKDVEWDKNFNTELPSWNNKIPVVVLINGGSASASEIVSGTLQDLDRGVVIGSKSFGKGLVQTTRPIGYNSRLKLTTAKYYTPSGRCIQAIDYSHNKTASDTNIVIYKTKGGRKVYGGGGVKPDILIEESKPSLLTTTIYNKNLIFDYANHYFKNNKQIAPPETFKLSESEFLEFKNWLSKKDYSYKSKSEILVDSISTIAKSENNYEAIKSDINSLINKIKAEKNNDLEKSKQDIIRLLESEIITRYYYQKGKIQQGLNNDKSIEKSIEILSSSSLISDILNKQ
jgi:carboxyl-terminal processing protease